MHNDGFETGSVIKKIYNSVMDNWKVIYKAVLVIWLITMLISCAFMFLLLWSTFRLRSPIVIILISLICVYIGIKITLVYTVYLKDVFEGNKVSFSEAYRKSNGLFWRFLGNSLLYALIMVVPVGILVGLISWAIVGLFLNGSFASLIVVIILYMVLFFVILILSTAFGLGPTISIIRPNVKGCLSYSLKLVQGRIFKVFLVFFIYGLVVSVFQIVMTFFGNLNTEINFISALVTITFSSIIYPFTIGGPIIIINELEKSRTVDHGGYGTDTINLDKRDDEDKEE